MDKKEKILDTALKLFVEYGLQGTPTSKIAEDAGVSNGTLFRYFKTKDELTVSLFIRTKDELNQYLSDKVKEHDDIKESFRELFVYATLWHLKNKNKQHFIQQFQYSPLMATFDKKFEDSQDKLPMSLFKKAFEKKIFKPYPYEMIWQLCEGIMNGMFKYLYNKKITVKEQKALLNDVFEMSWTMLIP